MVPEYFLILLTLLLTGFFLQRLFKIKIYKSTSHLLATNLFSLVIGTIWDQFAISRGHWSFGERFLLGPKIGYMPIEEYLFFLVIPYFGLVVYKIIEKKLR